MDCSDALRLSVGRNLTLGPSWQSTQPDASDSSGREAGNGRQLEKDSVLSRKRLREDTTKVAPLCSKATREKIRRDRLNDRFLDLGRELDPSLPPKTDKAVIMNDTVKLLARLKAESLALTEGNRQLRDQIKELKAEKSELREEKSRLKAERDQLQGQLQSMPVPATGCFTSQAEAAAAAAALQAAAVAAFSNHAAVKPAEAMFAAPVTAPAPFVEQPGSQNQNMGMWHWMPAAAADTSRDHILRPPVA